MPDLVIDLAAIPAGGYRLAIAVPATAFSLESPDVHLSDPVDLQASLQLVGTTVAVRGTITTTVEVPCARCVESAAILLSIPLEVVAVPTDEMPEDEDHELAGSELDLCYYTGEVLDLGTIVRDHLVSAIPFQPLCQPTCRGLCPSCGTNLNREACTCSTEEVDERLAVLKQWQERDSRT
ncbi:DUF177 domain-containing protein [Nitrospinae bacterium AH_259_B05_G02_I21]|nr:DUF177 domain-containing protein [Nitrospinae bacterium AH_259_B05_G02_I21]MDA2932260.1 DUF177 domain-containing protein [Nitrospinae bacterium AH-259-F20]